MPGTWRWHEVEVLARHVFHLQSLPIRRRRPRLDVADETLSLGGSTGGSTHARDIVLLAWEDLPEDLPMPETSSY